MTWPLKNSRDFSTRGQGTRQGDRSAKKSAKSEVQPHEGRNTQRIATKCGMATVVSVVIWQANQDSAPLTNRKRFMVINRDGRFLKAVTARTWDTLKRQFAARTLPKYHPTAQRVNRIGARIVEASGLKSSDWEFLVVDDEDTVNAFALPGGKVVIFTGMLGITPNDDSLAAILGHEVGHVLANHGGEKLSNTFAKEGLALLFVLAMEIDSLPGYTMTRAFGNLVFELYYLPSTKEMESEADYIGMQLMAKACFDPHEMPRTFSRMIVDDDKRGVTRDTTEHPPTEDRIAMQKEWMRSAVQTRSKSGCPDLARWGLG